MKLFYALCERKQRWRVMKQTQVRIFKRVEKCFKDEIHVVKYGGKNSIFHFKITPLRGLFY